MGRLLERLPRLRHTDEPHGVHATYAGCGGFGRNGQSAYNVDWNPPGTVDGQEPSRVPAPARTYTPNLCRRVHLFASGRVRHGPGGCLCPDWLCCGSRCGRHRGTCGPGGGIIGISDGRGYGWSGCSCGCRHLRCGVAEPKRVSAHRQSRTLWRCIVEFRRAARDSLAMAPGVAGSRGGQASRRSETCHSSVACRTGSAV